MNEPISFEPSVPHMLSITLRTAMVMVLWTQVCAAETIVQCPQRVRMESGKVADSDTPSEFRSAITVHSYLVRSLNAYDGPPENEMTLKPKEQRSGEDSRKRWTFNGIFKEGKWLSCDYGAGMVRLTTRIDDAIQSCTGTVKYKGDPSLPQAEFRCE